MKNEPECYGKMFPSVIALAHNEPVAGKVFGYQIDRPGIVATRRAATTNREACAIVWNAPTSTAVTGCQ
jgi:hypothetical protein